MMGRSILAYIPVNIANIIVSFGAIAILTRLLTAAEFGRYAVAMITMLTFHMLCMTWLEAAMERFRARAEREGDVPSHLKTLYKYGTFTSALFWAVTMTGLAFLPVAYEMKTALMFAITSTCLQLFLNLGLEAHKAAHRITRYSATFTAKQILGFVFGIGLILFTPMREAAPFFGIVLAVAICLIFDLPFMLKRMRGGTAEPERIKTYFKYGMPISISLVLTYALASGDIYIIKAMMGDASAGEYNAGYNLANRSLDMIFVWIAMAVTPIAVTALEKEGLEKSKSVMKDYGAALLWIAMPAATGIALVAEPAGFILGESVRAEAVKIMPLIAFAGVLNGMISYYAQRAFMLSGNTKMFVWAMVPPVVLNIGMNIVLIPRFGLMGAVYATVAAYALGFIMAVLVGRRYYPLPLPVKAFLQISFACLVMAGVVLALPISDAMPDLLEIIIKASVGVAVYGIICFGTDAANCRELIKGLVTKFRGKSTLSPSEVTS